MKINITDIENLETKSKSFKFEEIIDEFNDVEPVCADINVEIIGNLIRVKGQIKANVNLVCDVCLKDFTKQMDVKFEEFFTKYNLNEDYGKEYEIKNDGFVEDLNGSNEIDITDLIYQTVILNIPNKLVCDINCNGEETLSKYLKTEILDPRLEVFKNIKIEKDK